MAGTPRDNYADDSSGGLVAREKAGDNAEPLSVSALSQMLKRTVEGQFGYVRLRAELSGVKRAASGHMYCSLKDEKAVIDGVMWKGTTSRLAFQPEDGLEVIATGKLTTYPGRSKYQIVLESLEMAGEGALLALLEKTRQRLEAEGLFAPERKRALPFLPRTIGVVTSPTGAVIRDILHRLADRFPSHVLVWPVLVQGKGAADQVTEAIRGFGAIAEDGPMSRPDLLIVARGGGSIEDLWSFNEESVVRAIAESPIPVISAVGHETDTTLADYAADRRAPTPTAAAEMAVPVRAELAAALSDFAARQQRGVLRPLSLGRERLEARAQRLPKIEALLQPQAQKLDERVEGLRNALKARAAQGREALSAQRLSPVTLQRSLSDARKQLAGVRMSPDMARQRLARDSDRLAGLARVLVSLDPAAPLERGYAMIQDTAGQVVRSKAAAAKEDQLTVKFADGTLGVVPVGGAGRKRPKKPVKSPPQGAQEDLFG